MHISPGELNKRVVIEKKVIKKDTAKNERETWERYYSCWAKVNGLFGEEYYQAKRVNEETTLEIIIRNSEKTKAINTVDYRISFEGNFYNIKHKDPIQYKSRWIKLKAMER